MKTRTALAISIISLAVLAGQAFPRQTGESAVQAEPSGKRFQGHAQFKRKDGSMQDVQISVRRWSVPPKQKVEAPVEANFLLITLRAGKVITTINGKRQPRQVDDFWTLPEHSSMSVESTAETALLEVVSLAVH